MDLLVSLMFMWIRILGPKQGRDLITKTLLVNSQNASCLTQACNSLIFQLVARSSADVPNMSRWARGHRRLSMKKSFMFLVEPTVGVCLIDDIDLMRSETS